jgi:translation initiation factor 4E
LGGERSGGRNNANAWKENMKQVCSFDTVEDFWRYYNYLPKPSEVFYDGETKKRIGADQKIVEEYSLFKRGIEPEWGDPMNATGGEFFCRQFIDAEILNMYWQNLVLGVIGESMEDPATDGNDGRPLLSCVNGARIVDKGKAYHPMFKIEVWISERDPDLRERVRNRLFEIITDGCPTSKRGHPKFEWKNHS